MEGTAVWTQNWKSAIWVHGNGRDNLPAKSWEGAQVKVFTEIVWENVMLMLKMFNIVDSQKQPVSSQLSLAIALPTISPVFKVEFSEGEPYISIILDLQIFSKK